VKIRLTFFFSLLSAGAVAQNGYIKLSDDSVQTGYIRYVTSVKNGEQLIEFWKTKTDKAPVKFHKKEIVEYAIKKDTFLILKNFQPFEGEDIFFEAVDARIMKSGKVQLLRANNPYYNANNMIPVPVPGAGTVFVVSLALGGKIANIPTVDVLRESGNDYMRGVPVNRAMFEEVVRDFIPEETIRSFVERFGPVSFKNLKELVAFYNRQHR
jgi:hypothetical protein